MDRPQTVLSLGLTSLSCSQFFRFLLVGGTGFCIDASVLFALTAFTGIGPYAGRIMSFLTSMLFTWQCNRRFTFRTSSSGKGRTSKASIGAEGGSYLVISVIGAMANYLVYAWAVSLLPQSEMALVAGVALGSIAGLLLNFVGYKFWVFRIRRRQPASSLAELAKR